MLFIFSLVLCPVFLIQKIPGGQFNFLLHVGSVAQTVEKASTFVRRFKGLRLAFLRTFGEEHRNGDVTLVASNRVDETATAVAQMRRPCKHPAAETPVTLKNVTLCSDVCHGAACVRENRNFIQEID